MFRKIFSDVWLCSWKYHRKHIFYLLLTFSHIFSVAKWIYNTFIPQNTNKTQKKIIKFGHFVRLQSARRLDRDRRFAWSRSKFRAIVISAVPVMSADDISELGFGRSLLSLLSFPLSLFSHTLSLLRMTWKWFEGKMKV